MDDQQKNYPEDQSIISDDTENIPQSSIDGNFHAKRKHLNDEEYSSEITIDDSRLSSDGATTNESSTIIGWLALAASIISLFAFPILFGGLGIIVGFVSKKRDAIWLGNTAITIGIISIFLSILFRFF